jgi:hypothetical protein
MRWSLRRYLSRYVRNSLYVAPHSTTASTHDQLGRRHQSQTFPPPVNIVYVAWHDAASSSRVISFGVSSGLVLSKYTLASLTIPVQFAWPSVLYVPVWVALPRPLFSQNTIIWAARNRTWACCKASFDNPIPVIVNVLLGAQTHHKSICYTSTFVTTRSLCLLGLLPTNTSPLESILLHQLVASCAQSRAMDGPGSVIVPLYVYPSAGAWDNFHDVYDMYLYCCGS